MIQDQQTYKRAAVAALIGLIAQLVLAVGLALLGLYAQSNAFHAATWHFFGGLPIWVILWVIYNQHRLERVEALEAEELARADARTAAIFDEAGQQLSLARKRLERLYKIGLPAISALTGVYLLVVGISLFLVNWRRFEGGTLRFASLGEDANTGVLTIFALAIAFIAFLVARYVAGMTRVRDWQLLRGGASYLTGNFAVTLLLALASLLALLDNRGPLVALALVVPAVMALLGVEMLVGLLLGMYRPRRPGEVVRPAFDSRLLGWLTRPESLGKIISETLNYQFGFEISKSWFYRLLARAVTPLIIIGAVVLLAMTSLVIVAPNEQAVITTFGKFERVVEPGAQFKWPWPIGRADTVNVYRIRELAVGSIGHGEADGHGHGHAHGLREDVAILWGNDHTEHDEEYLLTAPTPLGDDVAGEFVAGELIGAEVVVHYRISDLKQYSLSAANPEELLEQLAARQVSKFFVTNTVDALLTTDRTRAGALLREQIQQDVNAVDDGRGLGIEVVFVGLIGMHPPQEGEVAAKFHEQVRALQTKQSRLQEAQKQVISTLAEVAGSPEKARNIYAAIRQLDATRQQLEQLRGTEEGDPQAVESLVQQVTEQELAVEDLLSTAGGQAAQRIHQARAYRWKTALQERAAAERFASQHQAYRQAPDYYKMRLYLQTLAEGLADRRKIIVASEQTEPATIRLNLETVESSLESILQTE